MAFIVGKFMGLAGKLVVNKFFMAWMFRGLALRGSPISRADAMIVVGLFHRSRILILLCLAAAVFVVFLRRALGGVVCVLANL